MNKKTAVVILAAGKGTRMKSALPKVLHPVLGRPMIHWVVAEALALDPDVMVPVVSWKRELVEQSLTAAFGDRFRFAHQEQPLGTGDAVKAALSLIGDAGRVLVLSGDVPLVTAGTLRAVLAAHTTPVTLVTVRLPDPRGYGRIIRRDGSVERIVEEKNASAAERSIDEVNAGLYCFDGAFLRERLPHMQPDAVTGEYYITELVAAAVSDGLPVTAYASDDYVSFSGINSRRELAAIAAVAQHRLCNGLMDDGVTIVDPARVYIEPGVEIASDVTIHPGVALAGITTVGSGAVIETGAVIKNSAIGNGAHIKPYCVIDEASVMAGASVGPFAHLRPGSEIGNGAKIGNFVETKKATIRSGAKVNHLSYIGDALVEENVNVGAGTITCNYDGEKKHRTHVKKGAFIGSNTALVAPVTIGEKAVVGAGSVITKDVPDDTLAVERAEQRHLHNWSRTKKRIQRKD